MNSGSCCGDRGIALVVHLSASERILFAISRLSHTTWDLKSRRTNGAAGWGSRCVLDGTYFIHSS